MHRSLYRISPDHSLSSLILEEINCVGRVMPQQMVCPSSWFSSCIDVFASKEISLRIQLLDLQLTSLNFFIDPLMRGIETSGMAHHADQACFLLEIHHSLSIQPVISQGNLNLNMHTCFQTLYRLSCVDWSWGGQDRSLNSRKGQRLI